jgi:nucleotide-binding universal stress UspA family protein
MVSAEDMGKSDGEENTVKVLVAVDGSSPCERAIQFVTRIGWPAGSRMIVANVMPSAVPADPSDFDSADVLAQQWCHRASVVTCAQNQLRNAGLSTERRMVEGDAREQLLQLVDSERVDLLVMGSRGESGLTRSMLGSVSSHAVGHASCSVLVVKQTTRR